MILLDTNVVSEPLKPKPDQAVLDWLDRQSLETLFISAITLAEVRYGVAVLQNGRRKDGLANALESRITAFFEARILPFDSVTATAYATIRAHARSLGEVIGATDGYIAATAAAHSFAVASRDTSPFKAAGLTVINPWLRN